MLIMVLPWANNGVTSLNFFMETFQKHFLTLLKIQKVILRAGFFEFLKLIFVNQNFHIASPTDIYLNRNSGRKSS